MSRPLNHGGGFPARKVNPPPLDHTDTHKGGYMKRILLAAAFAATIIVGLASPAAALHKAGGGGSCTRWIVYTTTGGWPQYRCTSYTYR